jgi:hypothetical protein
MCAAARVCYELAVPRCGVNLYGPDDEFDPGSRRNTSRPKTGTWINWLCAAPVIRQALPAEDVFGGASSQAGPYNDLLSKVGGDPAAVERLIDFERRNPGGASTC